LQLPVAHDRLPHALLPMLPPVHVSVQLPLLVQDIAPQAEPPVHAAVQLPVVHWIVPHACAPVHVMSHGFALHVMLPHALSAVQLMSHDAAFVQLIVPHALAEPQLMMQFQPVGQVTAVPLPVIVHVPAAKSHVPPQIAGHTAASIGRGASIGVPSTQ
jgi:hypothetical protein